MSENFRTPPEELQRLIAEVAEMKASLREIAGKLSRIEQHVKRAFGVPTPKSRTQGERKPKAPLPPATMSVQEALALFDELPNILENDGFQGVERRLGNLGISDLKLIVQEVGAPQPKTPSRKPLVAAIIGRANESRLLSRNRNVTQPKSSLPREDGEDKNRT